MRTDIIKEAITRVSGCDSGKWHLSDDMEFTVAGNVFPLLPWRFDRRLLTIRKLAIEDNVLRKICSYKSRIVGKCSDNLRKILYQELDVCEWLLNDKIVSVYAQKNGEKILSLILKTKKDILCSIEIALTLSENTPPVTKHEISGKEGLISDRSINEQIPVEAIYVFEQTTKKPEVYTDMDVTMLGLNPEEIMIADNIIAWFKNAPDLNILQKTTDRINYLADCVFQSVKISDTVKTEEER